MKKKSKRKKTEPIKNKVKQKVIAQRCGVSSQAINQFIKRHNLIQRINLPNE